MRWFRRTKRVNVGTFEPPAPVPPAPFERVVEEGLLMAEAAVRLAVKNQMILGALRDGVAWADTDYAPVVREELASIAEQNEEDAVRISADIKGLGQKTIGSPRHQHDYRWGDRGTLERRRRAYRAVAQAMRLWVISDAKVAEIAEGAHADAWKDVAAAVEQRLVDPDVPAEPIETYEAAKSGRLVGLLNDLEDLRDEARERRLREQSA